MNKKIKLDVVLIGVPSTLSHLLANKEVEIGIAEEAFGSDKDDTIVWVKDTLKDVMQLLPADIFTQNNPLDYPIKGYVTYHVDVVPGTDNYTDVIKILERYLAETYTLIDISSEMHP